MSLYRLYSISHATTTMNLNTIAGRVGQQVGQASGQASQQPASQPPTYSPASVSLGDSDSNLHISGRELCS